MVSVLVDSKKEGITEILNVNGVKKIGWIES